MSLLQSDKTYIFDSVEVKLTGRIAKKSIELSNRVVVDMLVEIQPVDSTGPTWKKWVKQNDLYEVSSSVE